MILYSMVVEGAALPRPARGERWKPLGPALIQFQQPSRHCEPPGRRKAPPDDGLREAIHQAAKKNGLLPPTRKGASADSKPAIARIASDGGSSLMLLAMTARHSFAISRLDMPEVCQKFPHPSQAEG